MEIRRDITFRFGIVYFAIAFFGLVIVARILYIQNVDTEKWKVIANDLKSNTTELWAKRGNICADDGSVLSTSVPYYELRLDLKAPRITDIFASESEMFVGEMSSFFGFPEAVFRARLQEAYRKGNRWFLINPEQIDHNKFQEFKNLKMVSRSHFGSGLIVVTENKRILPHGDLASRTIGVLNKGAFGGVHGNVGYTGIEGLAENYLAGQNGLALKRNLSGSWINTPLVDPQEGKDVITTINVNLQDYAQTALQQQMETSQAEWGTAIVMEVKTGDIKAIANLGLKKDGTYGEIYNYALGQHGCSEPGSTFKLMSMVVAMEDGYVDTADVFDTGNGLWEYRGQKMKDSDYNHGGHGLVTMKQIFELSSNIGTAKIITKYYEGKEKQFIDHLYNFGLNKPLGLGFQGEAVPYIKYPTDPDWWGPSLAWISHGYEIKIAPIQTLTFYNAVANNGVEVKPRFISEIRENGMLYRKFDTEILNPSICTKSTLHKAQDMLKGVVLKGTGKSLQNKYYSIAGKTGTAVIANENKGYTSEGSKKYQASFCGYFPADNPRFSCIVVIVGPKGAFYGGTVAGPVFRSIADKVYASYLEPGKDSIPPYREVPQVKPGLREDVVMLSRDLDFRTQSENLNTERVEVVADTATVHVTGETDMPGAVPNVIGMGANDAVYLLEEAGYKTKLNGFGRIFRQSPSPETPLSKGELVTLDLGFDQQLEIFKNDSVTAATDSIKPTVVVAPPVARKPAPAKKPVAKAKTAPRKESKAKASQTQAKKQQKPSAEAIKRWKAKVAAQKAQEKKKAKSNNKKG